MTKSFPIYSIAKELNINSNRIILACKSLGIEAKGSAKRLNNNELEKVKAYFEAGKNVSQEVVNLNADEIKEKKKTKKLENKKEISYFPNRLVGKP